VGVNFNHTFLPGSDWVATADGSGLTMWPLSKTYPAVIREHRQPVWSVAFGGGGDWLVSGGLDGLAWLTPTGGEVPEPARAVYRGSRVIRSIAVSPESNRLLIGADAKGGTVMVPLDGGSPSSLETIHAGLSAAFDRTGELAIIAGYGDDSVDRLYVVNADTLQTTAGFEPLKGIRGGAIFTNEGRILSAGASGLYVSDPETGRSERLLDGAFGRFSSSDDSRRLAAVEPVGGSFGAPGRAVVLDLETGVSTRLTNHGDRLSAIAMNAAGTVVVTGDRDGALRVGPASGEEPHMLLGHEGRIWSIDIDPLGRWIATGGEDTTVRIWPMPDLTKPPLHTLPHDELIAKLKSLTNLRVVRDDEDPTGWTLTHDPFPGWETVPSW
jgi:WD40 repeat protein